MINNNIPRPEETTYYENQPYTQLWNLVVESLQKNMFRIKPPSHITLYYHLNQLNLNLRPYGWIGNSQWVGSKDDGYNVLELKPLTEKIYNENDR